MMRVVTYLSLAFAIAWSTAAGAQCDSLVIGTSSGAGTQGFLIGQSFTASQTALLDSITLQTCDALTTQLVLRAAAGEGEEWNSGTVIGTTQAVAASFTNQNYCNLSQYGTSHYVPISLGLADLPVDSGMVYCLELTSGLALSGAGSYAGGTAFGGNGDAGVDLNFQLTACADASLVLGCTDSNACNYDASANYDNGLCTALDCNGTCGGSAYMDTLCNVCVGGTTGVAPGACAGCMDPTACNFDGTATASDNSCVYTLDCNGDCGGSAVSEPGCGCIGGNTGVDVSQCIDGCLVDEISNTGALCNVSFFIGQSFTPVQTGHLKSLQLLVCEGVDAQVVLRMPPNQGEAWNAGAPLDTSNIVLATSSGATCTPSAYGSDYYSYQTFEFTSVDANGYGVEAGVEYVFELLSGVAMATCTAGYAGGEAVNSNQQFSPANDVAFKASICPDNSVSLGCTDILACSGYNADATHDDGSCLYADCNNVCGGTAFYDDACNACVGGTTGIDPASCQGCMNSEACNFSASASVSDGSCIMMDCNGTCGGTAIETDCGCIGGTTGFSIEQCVNGCLSDPLVNHPESGSLVGFISGQSFTAAEDGMVTKIRLRTCDALSSSLNLRAYDAQSWNGGDLIGSSATLPATSGTTSSCLPASNGGQFYTWKDFYMDSLLVEQGETYVIELALGAGLGRYTDSYSGGNAVYSGDWESGLDLIFEVYTCLMVSGCTDSHACNYDETATIENGTCHYGTTYFEDADGDGFGNPLVTVVDCAPPTGFVENGEDDYPLNPALSQTGTALAVDVGTVLDLSNETAPYVVNGDLVNAGEILLPPVKNGFILDIKGDFINHGSITGVKSLSFSGEAIQEIKGNLLVVDSLVIEKPSQRLTISNAIEINSTGSVWLLNSEEAEVVVADTASFTLKSDAEGTAFIGALGEVQGELNFERYIPADPNNALTWVNLGSYVTGAQFSDWVGSSFAMLPFSYQESMFGSASSGWSYEWNTSDTIALERGYMALLMTPEPLTLSVPGNFQRGDVSVELTFTDDPNQSNSEVDGWHLITNPYPAPVDLVAVLNRTEGISSFWVNDNSSAEPTYAIRNQNGTGDGPQLLAVGQSAWVKVESPLTITFMESDIVAPDSDGFVREFDEEFEGSLGLELSNASEQITRLYLDFLTSATASYSIEEDGLFYNSHGHNKLRAWMEASTGEELSIQSMGGVNAVDSIPLVVSTGLDETIEAKLLGDSIFLSSLCVAIRDLTLDTIYSVGASGASLVVDELTTETNRFSLLVAPIPNQGLDYVPCEGVDVASFVNAWEGWNCHWENETTGETGDSLFTEMPAGYYEITMETDWQGCTQTFTEWIGDACMGDFNLNGERGTTDLLYFLTTMPPGGVNAYEGSALSTDLDCNGLVGVSDLLLLLAVFGLDCP